jgi:hypothetical protein
MWRRRTARARRGGRSCCRGCGGEGDAADRSGDGRAASGAEWWRRCALGGLLGSNLGSGGALGTAGGLSGIRGERTGSDSAGGNLQHSILGRSH